MPLNFVFPNRYEPSTVSTVCMIKKNYNRSSKQAANVCHTSVPVTVLKDMTITTSPTAVILLILYIKHALLWDCFVLGFFLSSTCQSYCNEGVPISSSLTTTGTSQRQHSLVRKKTCHVSFPLFFWFVFLHLYRRRNIHSLHMISPQSATEPVMNS